MEFARELLVDYDSDVINKDRHNQRTAKDSQCKKIS